MATALKTTIGLGSGLRYVRRSSVPERSQSGVASAKKVQDEEHSDTCSEEGDTGEGVFHDQSDVEPDSEDNEGGEDDPERYDRFDADDSGRKDKQEQAATRPVQTSSETNQSSIKSKQIPSKTITVRRPVTGIHNKLSCVERPTYLQTNNRHRINGMPFGGGTYDEGRTTPLPLREFDSVCTIGTGTFGRVLLMKKKTATGDGDEESKENRSMVVTRESNKDDLFKDQSSTVYYALKMMTIKCVIQTKQVQHVHSEKNILLKLNHPFIVKLHWTCRDRKCLYMLFDYAPGGELFSYLRASRRFGNTTTRFYAAEIVSALEYMHRMNVVYRDLKPENLLLDKEGHLKITDFGFAKELSDRTWTLCGTPEYLAPEVIMNKGHNKAVDWWALGVLIYEMHAGFPPFCGDNALAVYNRILDGKLKFSPSFNFVAKDLVRKLLQTDRTKRIGSMKPPIVPTLYHEGDTGNFDFYDEEDLSRLRDVSRADLDLFKDF